MINSNPAPGKGPLVPFPEKDFAMTVNSVITPGKELFEFRPRRDNGARMFVAFPEKDWGHVEINEN